MRNTGFVMRGFIWNVHSFFILVLPVIGKAIWSSLISSMVYYNYCISRLQSMLQCNFELVSFWSLPSMTRCLTYLVVCWNACWLVKIFPCRPPPAGDVHIVSSYSSCPPHRTHHWPQGSPPPHIRKIRAWIWSMKFYQFPLERFLIFHATSAIRSSYFSFGLSK